MRRREFESLHQPHSAGEAHPDVRFLGKEEVAGSIPVAGPSLDVDVNADLAQWQCDELVPH